MSDNSILNKEVLEIIREKYDQMFSAEKKVADFALNFPQKTVDSNVSELAKQSGVSDATVVRMCHHLGYTGYYQFRITLARDLGRKQYMNAKPPESRDVVEEIFHEYAEAMLAIGSRLDVTVMRECVELVKNCSVAHIIAVGNTASLAQYTGFRLGRLGVKCTYNVAAEFFMNHINLADPDDILIAISKSGTSKQIVLGLELGKEKGLKSIAITSAAESPTSKLADYVLLAAGKENPFNYYKDYSHINETAVIDAFLNFVTNEELIKTRQADKPEIILSEYKM